MYNLWLFDGIFYYLNLNLNQDYKDFFYVDCPFFYILSEIMKYAIYYYNLTLFFMLYRDNIVNIRNPFYYTNISTTMFQNFKCLKLNS